MISEYTRKKIGDEFILRSLDRVRVVGINTPLRLYELLELAEQAPAPLLDTLVIWEQALRHYEKGNFREAVRLFRSVADRNREDDTARLYINRCEEFLRNPPQPDWQGIHTLTRK
ncbi:MAG: hypothetical protein LBD78_06135 [Spirochaetaceae bacterium]|nr:hypothetical protein [Spirochaetaceae bacterium]